MTYLCKRIYQKKYQNITTMSQIDIPVRNCGMLQYLKENWQLFNLQFVAATCLISQKTQFQFEVVRALSHHLMFMMVFHLRHLILYWYFLSITNTVDLTISSYQLASMTLDRHCLRIYFNPKLPNIGRDSLRTGLLVFWHKKYKFKKKKKQNKNQDKNINHKLLYLLSDMFYKLLPSVFSSGLGQSTM